MQHSILKLAFSSFILILEQGKSMDSADFEIGSMSFEAGLLILLVAQLLSSVMGIYVQEIYAQYGNHWDSNLFYSHFLSLPLFLPLQATLRRQFVDLAHSPPLSEIIADPESIPRMIWQAAELIPSSVSMLALNALTQFACISGVNLLSAKTSAVTVTIVLNIRKLVSFILSIWIFGNEMSSQMTFGAILVFGSGALYGWETSMGIKRRKQTFDADKKLRPHDM